MFLQVEKGSQLHFFLRAVLQGFQQGVLVQQALAGQVGHRAGHPQDAVVGAGRKPQCIVGGAEQPFRTGEYDGGAFG